MIRIGAPSLDASADLHRRPCVRSTIDGVPRHRGVSSLAEIERVLHRARGMRVGNVERGEIVPVVLDLGTRSDRETQIGEDLGELVHHLADRVDRAWRGGVDAGSVRSSVSLASCRSSATVRARPCARRAPSEMRLAQPVDARPFDLALLRGHPAQRLHQLVEPALLAQQPRSDRLDPASASSAPPPRDRVSACAVAWFRYRRWSYRGLASRMSDKEKGRRCHHRRPDFLSRVPRRPGGERAFACCDDRGKGRASCIAMSARTFRSSSTPGELQPVHELRIGQTFGPDAGVDALDPQAAEGALLNLAVAIRVLAGLFDRLPRDANGVLATTAIALGLVQDAACAWRGWLRRV
jgi:hypothetical protein